MADDRRAKRGRARNRLRGSWRLLREHGPLEGLRRAARDWNRLGRAGATYGEWLERHGTLSRAGMADLESRLGALPERPLISVLMPVYDPPAGALREAIGSLREQVYADWELCAVDDASPAPHVADVLGEASAADPRIRTMRRERNGGISAASDDALAMARGRWIALFDHDDRLAPEALAHVALALAERPDADMLYTDEDHIDVRGRRVDPYFKPGFSVAHLLEQNFLNHLGVYRADLVRTAGGFRSSSDGSQDHDLALRCLAHSDPSRIVHVRRVLYHWRMGGGLSVSERRLEACAEAARHAVAEHVGGTVGETGAAPTDRPVVVPHPIVPGAQRIRWPIPDPAPLVTAIVPTRDAGDLVRQCLEGLLHRTDYPAVEALIVDNGSTDPASLATFSALADDPRVGVLSSPGPFNYAALNNEAAAEARGELLLLLNNDIDVIDPDWLREMVGQALRPGIGIVGAKLLYGDGTVQHAGVRLGMGHFAGGPGVAGHLGVRAARDDPGYRGLYAHTREVSAVTAACMLIRREAFEAVGGLDAERLPVAFNDIDLCLRVRARGWRTIYAAHAVLHHLESATRGSDMEGEKLARFTREVGAMRERWGDALLDDPFYSPLFRYDAGDFEFERGPLPPALGGPVPEASDGR